MAAIPPYPNQPGLPVPAPATASFASKYGDASQDPTGSNEGALLNPFVVNLVDPTQNVDTRELRNRVAVSGNQRKFLGATIVSGGLARLYVCPTRWEDGLTGTNPDLNGKYFAFEGELVNNIGHTVEIDQDVFNLLTNQHAVPTINDIITAIAADPNLRMMGPYTPADAHTEAVKTRRVVPVPHFIGGLFLAHPDGISARQFWEQVYPVIEGAGKVADCKALLQFFQLMMTSSGAPGQPSVLDTTRPSPPARNVTLIERQHELILHHFPMLRPDAMVQQASHIATEIGQLAHQQRLQYEEAKLEKEKAKDKTVESWLGQSRLSLLLRNLGVPDEATLNRIIPLYKEIASATKADRLGTLQGAINKELRDRGNNHLTITISPGVFENFASMEWHRLDADSLTSGFLGNLFLFGKTNEEQQREINSQLRLIQSGTNSVSNADAKEILKLAVNLPSENKSGEVLKRVEILCSVLLPPLHPFHSYIRQHLAEFENFFGHWEAHEISPSSLQPAKGVLHLQWLSLRLSQYWRDQSMSALPLFLPNPRDLFTRIQNSEPWVPVISSTLRLNLKLDTFCRMTHRPAFASAPVDDSTLVSGMTSPTTGTASTMAFNDLLRQLAGSRGGAGGSLGGTLSIPSVIPTPSQGSVHNPKFNEGLFGDIKVRKVNGKPVKSRDIRTKINRGETPELPPSKVDQQPMCLAWHTKGMCNPACPRVNDHADYTDAEYGPLSSWCSDHYPKAE